MVGAGLPQGFVALHPLVTDQDVLHRVVQRVAHVQLAGDVRRRHDDREGLFVGVYMGGKVFLIQPLLVQTAFDVLGGVGFFQFLFHMGLLSFCMGVRLAAGFRPMSKQNSMPFHAGMTGFPFCLDALLFAYVQKALLRRMRRRANSRGTTLLLTQENLRPLGL